MWPFSKQSYYDPQSNLGIELFDSTKNIHKIDSSKTCDWVFSSARQFIRHVKAGDFIIVEANDLEKHIATVKNAAFLWLEGIWVYLEEKTVYTIEIPGLGIKRVWFGQEFSLDDIKANTCLGVCSPKGTCLDVVPTIESIDVVWARCKASMWVLDDVHRDYVNRHDFKAGSVLVVKAGAGSGKTTTQLKLAEVHKKKRILYLAFNKSLVTEIEAKIRLSGQRNLDPKTFDALLHKIYIRVKGTTPNLTDLRAATIGTLVPWLQGKSYKVKYFYYKAFTGFCSDVKHRTMESYCMEVLKKKHVILEDLWRKVEEGRLLTFDTIRKQCFLGSWFKERLAKDYDMVFVDEVQDFDMTMLRMLLDDCGLPLLFVGDPRQSIYQWRGSINAFDYMPMGATVLEFYSTFRIAEPALSEICGMFKDCWMISKASSGSTNFSTIEASDKYVYLFRSWKQLLTTARALSGAWIAGFDQKIVQMRRLHEKLQVIKGDLVDVDIAEDDLPAFLRSISKEELEALIEDIEAHTVPKDKAFYKLYTVHAYKGLEEDIVRVANDVLIKEEPNLYYVAVTRGKRKIIMDERAPTSASDNIGKELDLTDLLLGALTKKSKVRVWTDEEDRKALDAVKRGISFELLAETLGRSVLAIELRLRKLASELVNRGQTVSQASLETGTSVSDIEELLNELKTRESASKKGKRWTEDEVNKVLGLVKSGKSLVSISLTIGRTQSGVVQKLKELALKYSAIGFSKEEIIRVTGLSLADVERLIV